MNTTYLNDIDGFSWATNRNDDGLAKISLCGESLWVKDVIQENDGLLYGVVDNHLIFSAQHGVKFGDQVSFHAA